MLIIVTLLLLISSAHAADRVIKCEPQRVHDNRYWSFRIIDGRSCWYPGRPGKPKSELRWALRSATTTVRTSEVEQPVAPPVALVGPEAAPDEPASSPPPLAAQAPVLTEEMLLSAIKSRPEVDQTPWQQPVALTPPKPQEPPSVWGLVLIVLAIIGTAFLLPILPRSKQWLTDQLKPDR